MPSNYLLIKDRREIVKLKAVVEVAGSSSSGACIVCPYLLHHDFLLEKPGFEVAWEMKK